MGNAIRHLIEAAQAVGYRVSIEVVGHTDKTGSIEENLKLGQARADYVLTALQAQALPELKMTAAGAGWRQPLLGEMTDQDRALNRRASLHVTLTDTAEE
jgi:outer membrane protein OmpA-like peptidoglycan-associated protein